MPQRVTTATPLRNPSGLTIDPLTGHLLVLDSGPMQLCEVDPATGEMVDALPDFDLGKSPSWAGVDTSPDGGRLFLTDYYGGNTIWIFERAKQE